jgi:hypothetical protein
MELSPDFYGNGVDNISCWDKSLSRQGDLLKNGIDMCLEYHVMSLQLKVFSRSHCITLLFRPSSYNEDGLGKRVGRGVPLEVNHVHDRWQYIIYVASLNSFREACFRRLPVMIWAQSLLVICTGRQVLEDDGTEPFYDEEDSVLKEITESLKENRIGMMNGSNMNPGILYIQPVVSSFMMTSFVKLCATPPPDLSVSSNM